jgi:N-carbamoyl-L-amino-acid hydrolase
VRNVICGRAVLGLDIRDLDDTRVRAFGDELDARIRSLESRRGVAVTRGPASVVPAVRSDPRLLDAIGAAATTMGHVPLAVPSGAGHDAQVMAAIAPVAMIFVPSERGVSHAPVERSAPEHLVAGAEVLLHALLEADVRLR